MIVRTMSKYRPIELSIEYVNSAIMDANGNQVSETVYNGLNQTALCLGAGIQIPQENLILELLKISANKSVTGAEKSVRNTLQAFAQIQSEQGNDMLPKETVDMFLLPLAFEMWQKDKVVFNLGDDAIDLLNASPKCSVSSKIVSDMPQVFWINPVKSFESDILGTLVLIKSEKNDLVEYTSDIYIVGWSFFVNESHRYMEHMTKLSISDKYEEELFLDRSFNRALNSNFLCFVLSFLNKGFLYKEMAETSKKIYKIPDPKKPPQNRFNEVREYDIHVSSDSNKTAKKE